MYHYFLWRQQDATRNAVSMAAHAHFPPARLHGVSGAQMQELLWAEKQINFHDLPVGFKRGRVIAPVTRTETVTYTDKRTGEQKVADAVQRSRWEAVEPPVFLQKRDWLLDRIPDTEK